MTTHPIDTFELREDLAAVRKLHADAADAVALRAALVEIRALAARASIGDDLPHSAIRKILAAADGALVPR